MEKEKFTSEEINKLVRLELEKEKYEKLPENLIKQLIEMIDQEGEGYLTL